MELNFCGENGRVQAVVQDVRTNKVLRVGYLNAATLKQMEAEKVVKLLENLYDEYGNIKYKPSPILLRLHRARHYGISTKRGFYKYDEKGNIIK